MLCLREHQVLCWRLRNKMHPLPPLSHEGLSPSFAQSAGDTAKKAATSRRKRYLSGSSAHSDFIAPSSPIYPPSRHGAASGAGAGPGPPRWAPSLQPKGKEEPQLQTLPRPHRRRRGAQQGVPTGRTTAAPVGGALAGPAWVPVFKGFRLVNISPGRRTLAHFRDWETERQS